MESTSDSGNKLALAPAIRRHFGVVRRNSHNLSNGKSLSKVKVTQDSAVDATLSRQLAESIKTVAKRVNAINTSFEEIKQTINDPLLNQGEAQNTGLVVEWSDLEKDFNTTLQTSSKVAKGAGAVIRDFLLVVMPYLMDDTDIKSKQKELGDYREELDRGGKLAFNFVSNFKDISRRVHGFKKHWGSHSAETIEKLATEIEELENSLSQANALLMQKVELKTLKKTIKAQGESARQVNKHSDGIQKGTVDLVTVWNFIYDDLNTIVSQLRLTERGDSQDLFRKRLSALDVQYRDLWNSLQTYSSATDPGSSSGKPSFFVKIFRQLGM